MRIIHIVFCLGNLSTGGQPGYILDRVVRRLDGQVETVEVKFAIGNLRGFKIKTETCIFYTNSKTEEVCKAVCCSAPLQVSNFRTFVRGDVAEESG